MKLSVGFCGGVLPMASMAASVRAMLRRAPVGARRIAPVCDLAQLAQKVALWGCGMFGQRCGHALAIHAATSSRNLWVCCPKQQGSSYALCHPRRSLEHCVPSGRPFQASVEARPPKTAGSPTCDLRSAISAPESFHRHGGRRLLVRMCASASVVALASVLGHALSHCPEPFVP